MAYQTPPQWIHGNVVTATQMETYNQSLIELNTAFGTNSLHNAAGAHSPDGRWGFIHTHRYLWYKGAGFVTNPSDRTQQVSLSDTATSTTWERFDLSTVDWIYPGFLYEVSNVDGAMELWR